jgi:tRNA(fMet)-specific endonuclease VapC
MNGNDFLVDTNIIIEVLKKNKDFIDKLDQIVTFYVSSIVCGELLTGVYRAENKEKQLQGISLFLESCEVLQLDFATANSYAQIAATLQKKGKPIPTNDIWIAATAKQFDLTVITKDKHFAEVEELKVVFW